MNDLQVFSHEDFGGIRVLEKDGQPWFVGKDVAEILGYAREDNAIRSHVDDEDKLTHQISASGQNRNMTMINESGMYSLILSSKLPKAKEFKHWVTGTVLPSIHRTGGYAAGNDMDYIIKSVVSQTTTAVLAELPVLLNEAVKSMMNVAPRDERFSMNALDWNEIAYWEGVLAEWRDYRNGISKKDEADKRFVADYNTRRHDLKLSRRTLYRKWRAYNEKGGFGLLDRRGRHGNHKRTVVAEITVRAE